MTTPDNCPIVGHEYEPAATCRACAAERIADTQADTSPMRPAEAPDAIRAVAERHRSAARQGSRSGRDFGQPADLRAVDGMGVLTCGRRGCGGAYLGDPDSVAAHVTVFGHQPEPFPVAKA